MSSITDEEFIIEPSEENDIEEDATLFDNNIQNIDIISNKMSYNNYYSVLKKTQNRITKFEKAKIIGIRAQMISSGALPCIQIPKGMTHAIDIANLEFNTKKIPLLIRRYTVDNHIEDWRLEDFVNL